MKHLIRSVFAKCKTGQAIAQLLKGGDEEMSSLSKPFFSKQHDREIDCEKFSKFLQDKILLTLQYLLPVIGKVPGSKDPSSMSTLKHILGLEIVQIPCLSQNNLSKPPCTSSN
jgi:hypothetical protein